MTGYEELDSYGDWVPDATYGNVWFPRVVPVGWAPYRYGQWRWVRPWGWTWVDHAPWGYAPFHYGRWVTIGDRWGWWPGGHHVRPVWAPALVGFVGGGTSISIGFGGPVVGWYPLAPWHRYQPHYRHNPRYVTIINQTIINNPPRGHSPHRNHEGATMVPGPRFRDPVMKVALPVRSDVAQLRPTAPPPKNIAPIRTVAEDTMVRRPNQVQTVPQAPASASIGRTLPTPSTTPAPAPKAPTVTRVKPPIVAEPIPNRGVVSQPPLPGNDPAPAPKVPTATRVTPPMAAEPIPNRGVTPQPPLPGNDPAPLAQPPKFNRASADCDTDAATNAESYTGHCASAAARPHAAGTSAASPARSTRGTGRTRAFPARRTAYDQAAESTASGAHRTATAPQPVARVVPPQQHRNQLPELRRRRDTATCCASCATARSTDPLLALHHHPRHRNPRRARNTARPKSKSCVSYRGRSRWCSSGRSAAETSKYLGSVITGLSRYFSPWIAACPLLTTAAFKSSAT